MIRLIVLILLTEVFVTIAQTLFKKGSHDLSELELDGLGAYLKFMGQILSNPLIWLGFAAYGISMIIWLMVLSEADLSAVFPISSIQYLLNLWAAKIFLNERIDKMRILGTLLIILGVTLIAFS